MNCEKCKLLNEFYDQVPQTDRNYWLYTELFVMLHGGDVCID